MATAASKPDDVGTIVQAWVPSSLAGELKAVAQKGETSVSAQIRAALIAHLQAGSR